MFDITCKITLIEAGAVLVMGEMRWFGSWTRFRLLVNDVPHHCTHYNPVCSDHFNLLHSTLRFSSHFWKE